ncbi:IS256 family transposase [Streptomyces cinereoruber]
MRWTKRQRRLTGVDEMVLSLSAKGLTHGEISAHLAEVYGAEVSKQTISTITDSVMEGMAEWQARPLDRVYPVVFIDCVNVKIRDGQVANRPVYMALAVTAEGHRDILGLWAGGEGGEGAKHWLRALTELKNRGVEDVLMLVCDGLKGLPDAVGKVAPDGRADLRRPPATGFVPLCGPSGLGQDRQSTEARLHSSDRRHQPVPGVLQGVGPEVSGDRAVVGERAWAEFVPFLQFDAEIRRIVCTTNAIESVNARIRRAVRARGHFPSENAALKCVYLAVMSLDPTGTGRKRWTSRWKRALQAFDIAFDGRLTDNRI